MKTKYLIFSALALLAMSVTACGGNNQGDKSDKGNQSSSNNSSADQGGGDETPSIYNHDHSFASGWESDSDNHWHACSVKKYGVPCDAVDGLAAHDWDDGTVVTAASAYKPGTMRYACNTCGRTKVVNIAAENGNEAQGNFTFDDTALGTAQEIHTTNQLGYLNLNKPYYSMTGSDLNQFQATGSSSGSSKLTKESWAPKAVTVSWNYTAPAGKTVSNYNFVFGQKEDLADAYQLPNAVTTSSVSFTNAYLGTNYFKVIANLNDGSKEASPIKSFKVTEQAPRNLDVGDLPNCRDAGGRTTYAGGKIRQGLVYRTAGNKYDNNSTPNSDAKSILQNLLRVRTEINVADKADYDISLTGTKVEHCYMDYGSTPYSNIARNAEKIRNVIDIFADESNYPIYYHCRIGTDRTGITGVIFNGLIGVPFNEVIQDYGFSNFSPIDNQRYPHKPNDTNGDDIAKYIDEFLSLPGETFQEQVYLGLRSIGIPASKLNKIIDIMTEGSKAQLPDTSKVGNRSKLVLNGESDAAIDANYNAPEVSFPIAEDESVEYKATFTEGQKDIVVYLGSSEASDSVKLADRLSLLIDGQEQDIVDKSMHKAGFGTTSQNKRTGFMFNLLGKYQLSAGEHTIEVMAKTGGSFKVASICVFDHVTPFSA